MYTVYIYYIIYYYDLAPYNYQNPLVSPYEVLGRSPHHLAGF